MEIRHLKMIQEVAKQGNLSKAAEHLYLSQSALSHQLKEIESFFETQLFIRQKKQMLLTAIVEDNLNPKLNYTTLFKDEFVAVVPRSHTWARLKCVEYADFFDENYIMYNIPNEVSTIFKTIFSGGHPKKVYKIALTEAILQMVKAGMGVTVLPHWVIRPYIEGGELIAVPITRRGIKRTWYAATLKNKVIPPYMNTFIKNLSKHLKQCEELAMLEYN